MPLSTGLISPFFLGETSTPISILCKTLPTLTGRCAGFIIRQIRLELFPTSRYHPRPSALLIHA